MPEQLGRRIAQLRMLRGWTQQALAERLAVSRVAVSHLESGIAIPGERTITLLAGLFKLDPAELIAGCTYPEAKADRLPNVACRYTEAELQSALLQRDMCWLERLRNQDGWRSLALDVCQQWFSRLDDMERAVSDTYERELLAAARAGAQTIFQAAMRETKS